MKRSNLFTLLVLGSVLFGLSLTAWLHPPKELSVTERRPLSAFPEMTVSSLADGTFMQKFDTYTLDQFPGREWFRRCKAIQRFFLFQQLDNHDIYLAEGYASALAPSFQNESVDYAMKKFQTIYDTYLADTQVSVYNCIIPDKNYYLAERNGYPVMDYEELFQAVEEGMPYSCPIDITDCLSIDCYYRTDTHWKQETLLPVSKKLLTSMENTSADSSQFLSDATLQTVSDTFYGVYYGQSALPMEPDTISCLSFPDTENATVHHLDTGEISAVYDTARLSGRDPYDFFLSGAQPLLVIDNPSANTERELILFRDSFGSSIAPLLLPCYRKITLVDIRYIHSQSLGSYLTFNNQDVLFLYSTLILNSSSTLK